MTVKELIKKLQGFDPEERVSLSSDEEGNEFHDVGRLVPELDENEKPVITIYPR